MADLPKLDKPQLANAEHATDFDPPIYNVWRQQAKERQGKRTDLVETLPPSNGGKSKDSVPETLPEAVKGESRDKAGAAYGSLTLAYLRNFEDATSQAARSPMRVQLPDVPQVPDSGTCQLSKLDSSPPTEQSMGSITTRHRTKLPPYLPPRPRNVDLAIWLPASHERTNPLRARYDHVTATLPHRNDPTPEEIAEACEAIQATWSDGERERRKVVANDPLVARVIAFAELVGALAG